MFGMDFSNLRGFSVQQKTDIDFTSAQILGMNAANAGFGLQLLPPCGLGKMNFLHKVILRYIFGGVAYTTAGAFAMLAQPANDVQDHVMLLNLNGLAASKTEIWTANGDTYNPPNQENQGIYLICLGGSPTLGNGILRATLFSTIERLD